jgi:NTE family protein
MSGIAFVLSGGGSHGAVQVGMAEALLEAGVGPDALFGTSVGAINSAVLAQGFSSEILGKLQDSWLRMADERPLKVSLRHVAGALLGKYPSLLTMDGVRTRISRNVSYSRIEAAPIPLQIVATDLLNGVERAFVSGDLADVIMASCAVPGLFPPVEIEGRAYVDGLLYGAPVAHAAAMGYKDIYLLSAAHVSKIDVVPSQWWAIARRAGTTVMLRHLNDTHRSFGPGSRLHVLPAVPQVAGISRRDFRRSEFLIDHARRFSRDWLARESRAGS